MVDVLNPTDEEILAGVQHAIAVLQDLPGRATLVSGAGISTLIGEVDRLGALCGAGRFTLTGQAEHRGEISASQAGSTRQWVAERCPSLEEREAGVIARAVRDLENCELTPAKTAVQAGLLSVAAARVVADEFRQLKPLTVDEAHPAVLEGLVSLGCSHGRSAVRALRPRMLAEYGHGLTLQKAEDRIAGLTCLSRGADIGGGISEYRMRLTPEARAVLEAAIGPLSAPVPDATGLGDPRSFEQRRGQALVEVCRRATEACPDTTPSGVKASVFVTVGMDGLRLRSRPGTVFGGLDTGDWLGPETVRRLACDGAVTPVLLGPGGQVMALGRTRRLFSPSLARALWLRDKGCTFDGCTVPAHWCDAHHIRHWSDGGPTDLANGALLCGRHHTVVHRDRLTATVTATGVSWDRYPGSYDRALARSDTQADGDADGDSHNDSDSGSDSDPVK